MNYQQMDLTKKVCIGIFLPLVLFALVWYLGRGENGHSPQPNEPQTEPTIPQDDLQDGCYLSLLLNEEKVTVELENYLLGVVLAEMPASFEMEAIKAQAVAARTYTLKHCSADSRHGKNTICAQASCCQAYIDPETYIVGGGSLSSVERARYAVDNTAGQVLTYEDALIFSTYFSCSGGMTESAVEVWGQDIPYLQSVQSPGEDAASFFTDSKVFSAEQFQSALGIRLKGAPDTWFTGVNYTDGGGVETMTIGGVAYRGTTLRTLLGLRSTAFYVKVEDESITFHTKGYGHRVGMSQYGANAMAKQGYDYQQILSHYYVGAEIVQYFEENNKTKMKFG